MAKNEKLSLIDFLRVMTQIVPNPKCHVQFFKNLLELFNNIDVDGNLVLEWNELLLYILENRQFIDDRLVEGISEEDKLEIFYSHKSDYQMKITKRKKLFGGKTCGTFKTQFKDDSKSQLLIIMNTKTSVVDIYSNKFSKPVTLE
jgi:hypothetical protein